MNLAFKLLKKMNKIFTKEGKKVSVLPYQLRKKYHYCLLFSCRRRLCFIYGYLSSFVDAHLQRNDVLELLSSVLKMAGLMKMYL